MDDKLQTCQSHVRQQFTRLESRLSSMMAHTSEEKNGPGRKFLKPGGKGWICRLHPKGGHIVIGFPNAIRHHVQATGRMIEGREDAAWVNHGLDDDEAQITALIERARDTA
jgi:hypothetical protein